MTIFNLDQCTGPKYKALASRIEQALQDGDLKPGDRLPTHRQLAEELGVTVGTVTRAYAEAERRRLVEARVGSGTYVRGATVPTTDFQVTDSTVDTGIDLGFSKALELDQAEQLQQSLVRLQDSPVLPHLLRYQSEFGLPHQREVGRQWLQQTGLGDYSADEIMVTLGGQHGFFVALLGLTQAGDGVACEGLTYPGLVAAANQQGLRLMPLAFDDEGLLPGALEAQCLRQPPRVLYLMTRQHNPTGGAMSAQRIDELARLCRQYQIVVLEDDVQGCLGEPDRPSFSARHPDLTVTIASLSKALCGGLHVGFMRGPERWIPALSAAFRATCWMAVPLTTEVACEWLTSGYADQLIATQKAELDWRHNAIQARFTAAGLTARCGGFNVWLELPSPWRAVNLVERAAEHRIRIKAAEVFAAGQYAAPQAVRLCIGGQIQRATLLDAIDTLIQLIGEPVYGRDSLNHI
ncbi:PLP-dependent aminotransferase family protein [Saccharospirillum mangrovi]|uniref:aminotransferase-like domain-containing protein n=1 Tax=Saccharospirillum mangrovi TaxID=2161747 RepID=UPI000D39D134|nr:PLP-dependent aminotransferase family protein [Saccharospirillum mangrovi]